MGMALKADVTAACKADGSMKPVDLVHLSGMTMGDRDLEAEVLSIFAKQAQIYLSSWEKAADAAGRKQAAHLLKGAARGIGAWELARLAEEAEEPAFSGKHALAEQVRAVCVYIRSLQD
jgi:HPt (histidine-containing phosphotransfer) domain-containing protein